MGTVHAHEGKSHHFVRGKTNLAEGTRGSGCHAAKKLCSQKKALNAGDGGASGHDATAQEGDNSHTPKHLASCR